MEFSLFFSSKVPLEVKKKWSSFSLKKEKWPFSLQYSSLETPLKNYWVQKNKNKKTILTECDKGFCHFICALLGLAPRTPDPEHSENWNISGVTFKHNFFLPDFENFINKLQKKEREREREREKEKEKRSRSGVKTMSFGYFGYEVLEIRNWV